jgi:two-component system, NtrC family, nitrogen regulation sensor histidine kinase NtrY
VKLVPRSTEVRLALVILFTSLVPLVVAVWLANAMFRTSSRIWTKTEVGAQLDRGVDLYKDYVRVTKDGFRSEARAIAVGLRADIRAAEPRLEPVRLEQVLASSKNLLLLELRDENGKTLSRRTRSAPLDEAAEKPLEVTASVDETHQLVAVFVAPKAKLDELDTAGRIAAEFHQLEGIRSEIYSSYVRAFTILLGLTLTVTALLGFLLARGITQRVRRLEVASRRVARGDLTVQIPVTGTDELTDLARTFNQMIREIERSRTRIEFLQRMAAWQEMAQRLAHEIKNPLTPIQLSVQECHRKYDRSNPEFTQMLDRTVHVVEEEVGSLRRLVTHFSNFAHLPSSHLESGDLNAFLREQKLAVEAELRQAGTVDWSLASGRAELKLDPQLFRRVLVNLLQNAWDACRGSERANVRVATRTDADSVELTIEDSGPGVPEQDRERIFDPYVTGKADGNGLGLAIVKKIVVEHDGQISVERGEALGGARFVVRLPRVAVSPNP